MATPVMKRLMREAQQMAKNPVREYHAYPLDGLLEWHFTMRGPDNSPYADGLYHGRILVPTNYPFHPPDVVLITPNGRFELEKRICLSISSYHPENWQSTWGIATVLTALRDFMKTPGNNGIGAIEYPNEVRQQLATKSRQFTCPHCHAAVAEHLEIMEAAPSVSEAAPPIPATPQTGASQPADVSPGAPLPQPSPLAGGQATVAWDAVPALAQPSPPDTNQQTPPAQMPQDQAAEPVGAAPAAPAVPQAPAPQAAVAPPRRVHVQRRGERVEVQLSSRVLDTALFVLTAIALIIVLKKLVLDGPRPDTVTGQILRSVWASMRSYMAPETSSNDDILADV
jgi:ubiquitin-conjugating enzyme E2 J1